MLKENQKCFGMDDANVNWREYVTFIDDIVYKNILLTIGVSLGYIVEQMFPSNNLAPLFESQLELLEPSLIFVPSLDPKDKTGFNNLLILLIEDIIKMSSVFKSVKTTEQENYMAAILQNNDIIDMKYEILEGVEKVVEEAADFCNGFERYSYLWLDDRVKCMEMFLEYGRFLEVDELDLIALKDLNAPQPSHPTIESFREQIDNFESLYAEIEKIEPFQVFNAWFQVRQKHKFRREYCSFSIRHRF